ncbi:hypothetical protein ACP70R_001283 [Stipagrostis hirtigluma subsp. patula]
MDIRTNLQRKVRRLSLHMDGINEDMIPSGISLSNTLELDGYITDIPSDIITLPHLWHLCVPPRTRLPDGLGNMKSLRSLWSFNLGLNSVDNLTGLGELINLRELGLCDYVYGVTHIDVLWSSIGNLIDHNLRILQTEPILSTPIPAELISQTISPRHLERLQAINWQFPRLPKWTA